MKPPADRHLDLSGAGCDLPLSVRPRPRFSWPLVLGIVGLLGPASAALAWQIVATDRSAVSFAALVLLSSIGWAAAAVALNFALVYHRETKELAARATQLEMWLVEARLKSLQQQLHPHFLFNTLHAISSLMHTDLAAADRTLMRLSDLLRLTLERLGEQEVTLDAELDFLRKYLEIERTRFADRLIVRFDVQPETRDVLVPTLLLQPLVENAIKYGVARKSGKGHVDISARREHDKLRIEVRDNGIGLSEDALTALQKGIGVSTTRARLQHQFGADYRFEFHRLAEGVGVVVAVPWRRKTVQGIHKVQGEQHEKATHRDRGRRAAGEGTPRKLAFGRTGY